MGERGACFEGRTVPHVGCFITVARTRSVSRLADRRRVSCLRTRRYGPARPHYIGEIGKVNWTAIFTSSLARYSASVSPGCKFTVPLIRRGSCVETDNPPLDLELNTSEVPRPPELTPCTPPNGSKSVPFISTPQSGVRYRTKHPDCGRNFNVGVRFELLIWGCGPIGIKWRSMRVARPFFSVRADLIFC
jgi:hypothetical protein